jgi:hypothetical protein
VNDPGDRVSDAWKIAGQEFGIDVVAPYFLRCGASSVRFEAFLPSFGSQNGMVVGLTTNDSSEAHKCAEEAGLFCSYVNPEVYREFKKKEFWEALKDWGYFGPKNGKPKWRK